jgi:hypothetical protein
MNRVSGVGAGSEYAVTGLLDTASITITAGGNYGPVKFVGSPS